MVKAIFFLLSVLGTEGAYAMDTKHSDTAIFAGGCFWCVESAFDKAAGVKETISGYIGGHIASLAYEQVVAGGSGHREALKVVFDPSVITYEALLKIFWHNIDPLDAGGQFCDRGYQYTSAVYYQNDGQKAAAIASSEAAAKHLNAKVITEILPATTFYLAEDYHQDYHQKNPIRYNFYRFSCGRDKRLKALWEDED